MAQQPSRPRRQAQSASACRSDYQANCAGVPTGGAAALQCLQQNAAKTSPACQQALASRGRQRARGTTSCCAIAGGCRGPAFDASSGQAESNPWPHVVTGESGTAATIYQPQVISWPEPEDAQRARCYRRHADRRQGAHSRRSRSRVRHADRARGADGRLTDPRLMSCAFRRQTRRRLRRSKRGSRAALATLPPKTVPLATVVMSLREQAGQTAEVALDNTPPRIFVSTRPREPRRVRRRAGARADHRHAAVVCREHQLGRVLRFEHEDVVPAATTAAGSPRRTPRARGCPPASCRRRSLRYPHDANFADVKKQIPRPRDRGQGRADGLRVHDARGDHRDQRPAAIRGRSRDVVAIRDEHRRRRCFAMSGGRVYYLVSGAVVRSRRASTARGPSRRNTLPADFARIPANGPRGFVLVSVPGTRRRRRR